MNDGAPTHVPRRGWRFDTTSRIVLALAVAVAIAQLVFYFCRTVDDAYISLRYAERLVAGSGLTFNDGQRVEGFSNPTWVALQALLISFGLHGVVATKLLSLASYLMLLVGVHRLARDVLALPARLAAVSVLLVAASSYVASWSILGLETPLHLALLAWLLVAFHHRLRTPTRRSAIALAAVATAFVATRPEAPLYLVAIGAAHLALGHRAAGAAFVARVRTLVLPGLATALLVGALLLARHAYYGLWFPQTYYAKQGAGFDLAHLLPLVAQGASPLEIVYLVGAIVLAAVLAVRTGYAGLVAVAATNMFFVAAVTVDWMPNQRHFLPLVALAPLPWLWALDRLAPDGLRRLGLPRRLAAGPAWLIAALLGAQAIDAFALDSRFSVYDFRTHGGGVTWRRTKSVERWRDALDGLAGRPPAHVANMSVHGMGMIDQLFRVLEAAATPERESWFIGRDIGRLGFYSPIQIFETAGLFTPALTDSTAWRQGGRVDDALIDAAFAHAPVATDLLDDWSAAVARRRDLLARHDVLVGGAGWVGALRPKEVVRPSPFEVLERYDRVARAFATPFLQATLYGESVGGAVAKRYAWIRPQLLANAVAAPSSRAGLEPAVPVDLLDGAIRLHGCAFEPPPEPDPDAVTLACVWEAQRPIGEDWTIFVHLVDPPGAHRVNADHAPRAGLWPTTHWRQGERIRDAVVIDGIAELRASALSARVGLFTTARRAPVPPGPSVDDTGRVIGPSLR